ncbi:MAG: phospholipase D-like domain-containing protein [Candidatus Woesearchaeota archaeon]|jgi:phosphatidylserine/phosphatidylglycerophosphate/cardiolipin synthase-like enzyme|nr:phospholipase D-like domain-containing protein [Candidatus Woesearchaeota archaeon]MDP7324256.1 phospholipase D-like domain-containing protein [Candidatus Woesearchaeota archaeon]
MKKEVLLILIVLLSSCTPIGAAPFTIPRETTELFEVYFCPQDNCEQRMINFIEKANTVDCAFYDLNLENLMNLLNEKNARVVVDQHNKHKAKTIKNLRTNKKGPLMHNKFCILDNNIIITGSMNPTKNGNSKNNNNIVILSSPSLAKNYQEEFDELWQGTFSGGSSVPFPIIYLNNTKIESYFCPEDLCKEKVLSLLNPPLESILFMTFSLTDPHIASLLAKKAETIEVKGVGEKRRFNMKYEQYKSLNNSKVLLKPDTNPAILHHKVFIIDKKIVITGSFNPTKNANERNDENILIIHDEKIAQQYLEEFYSLWG